MGLIPSLPLHRFTVPAHRSLAAACRVGGRSLLRLFVAVGALVASLLASPLAHAQLLDELDLRREGDDVILEIRFVSGVQLLRAVAASAGDQSLIYYRVLPGARGAEGPAAVQTGRSSLAVARGIPAVTVTDEAEAGRTGDERRLLVRFAGPVRHHVRSGRGERQIDVVLQGAGVARAAPPAASAGAEAARPPPLPISSTADGRYQVTLGESPSAPIPAALQHINVFTTPRIVDGRTVQETHLGPFATRAEAEWVLAVLKARFPGASITLPAGVLAQANVPVPTTTLVIPSAPSSEPLRPSPPPRPAPPAPASAAAAPQASAPTAVPPATAPRPPAAASPAASSPAPAPAAVPLPAPPPVPVAVAPAVAAAQPASAALSTAATAATAAAAPSVAAAPDAAASASAAASAASAASAPAAAASTPATTAAVPPANAASAATTVDTTPANPQSAAEVEARAAALMATAREAMAAGKYDAAIEALSALLDLPPNSFSRAAQALIGEARLKAGDTGRARAEFEAFLRLYPQGADADRARAALVELGAPLPTPAGSGRADPRSTTITTGSVSLFYYGGQSKIRTQEFQESPISGLPELVSDATLSSTDQKQWVGSTDLNWRHRDPTVDQRFVFRDTYTRDEARPDKSRNRLSALYYDHRAISDGWQVRFGRQSPVGGGVLGRFDGLWAGYYVAPRWRASVVAGEPSDALLDTRRRFYGGAIEAEALTPHLGATLYGMQQTIDGQVDRRAVGSDWRYFDGGLVASAQFDYDVMLKGLNIASLQGSWQRPDNSVFTFLYDRRKQPILSLGNTLFFIDPNLTTRPQTITDLLATGTTVEQLQERARAITATSTQAALGFTTPVTKTWQVGADVRLSNTSALAPVADILPSGQPSTGNIWSLGGQLIGTNLYSLRDTHVFIASALRGPTFHGELVSYNNSSALNSAWQLEPSLKWYRQYDSTGLSSTRWTPGMRVTWRVQRQWALESEVSVESSKSSGPNRSESSTRTFYYLGGRFEF